MRSFFRFWPDFLRRRFNDTQRFAILCVLTGFCCALAAVLFHKAIGLVFGAVWGFANAFEEYFHWILLAAPTLGGLIVGLLSSLMGPRALGSGIPQTKVAYYNDFGKISLWEGVQRFLLGVIFVGSGNSLGREGPTVHFCAAIASSLGRAFRLARGRVQALVPVGMGAGIAAAFNAPLSAITFVFEELLQDFSTKALAGLVLAVVTAATVYRLLVGEAPLLAVQLSQDLPTASWMLVALPLGLAAGLVGHLFTQSLLSLRARVSTYRLPEYLKPALGGLGAGCLGLLAWELTGQSGVFSIGYESLRAAFANQLSSAPLFILFGLKLLAVLLCYSCGGSGGLFSPTLFLGGMLGGLFGIALVHFGEHFIALPPHLEDAVPACVLLGMGALFASTIRCPFTSLLIIFEMTRDYGLILPLMVGNLIAFYVAFRLRPISLYDALIAQDGEVLKKTVPYQDLRDAQNLPISALMTYTVEKISARLTPASALKSIKKERRVYPLVDEQDRLIALITHEELLRLAKAAVTLPLQKLLLAKQPPFAFPEDSLREASAKMVKENVDCLVVVDPHHPRRVIGIISLHDIARQQNALAERLAR